MLLISISTFVCIAFAVMAVYWLMFRPASATAVRLRELDDQSGGGTAIFEDSPVMKLAERITAPIDRLVPPSAADAKKLQKKLMMAGYRSAHATSMYRVLQLVSMVVCPGAILLLWTYLARPMMEASIAILFAFAAGFLLPRFILNRLVASRQLRITWGLADALDLMVITMEAGLGLDRKSTRLNSSHLVISYAVFCLKKKNSSRKRTRCGSPPRRSTPGGSSSKLRTVASRRSAS